MFTIPGGILVEAGSQSATFVRNRGRLLYERGLLTFDTGKRELHRRVDPFVLAWAIKASTYTSPPEPSRSLPVLVQDDEHTRTMATSLKETVNTALGTAKTYLANRLPRRTPSSIPSLSETRFFPTVSVDAVVTSGMTGEFTNAHDDLAFRLAGDDAKTQEYLAGFTGSFGSDPSADTAAAMRLFNGVYGDDKYSL